MMKKEFKNDKFISWFIGFCDAECSFISNLVPRINKDKKITSYRVLYRIQIGLNIIDRSILELINSKFDNIGKIYDYPTRKESTLSFTSLESMRFLIENVFSKNPLLTSYQANRYATLEAGLLANKTGIKSVEEFDSVMINTIDPKFEECSQFYLDHWLVGFLNGEVSFTTFKGKAGNTKPKVSLEHTSEKALQFFKNHLELGPKVSQLKQRDSRKITYRIDVTSVSDLSKICKFLDRTNSLQGNKLSQYEAWKNQFNL
jgi:hypothetical protein